MPGINPIRFVDYVCNQPTIKIEAKHDVSSSYVYIYSKVNNKIAFEAHYFFPLTEEKEDFHEKVKIFCNAILMFDENEIQEYIDADKIMPSLYIYRHLKEVRDRSGKLVWRRS